jgi:hypothetical protein
VSSDPTAAMMKIYHADPALRALRRRRLAPRSIAEARENQTYVNQALAMDRDGGAAGALQLLIKAGWVELDARRLLDNLGVRP